MGNFSGCWQAIPLKHFTRPSPNFHNTPDRFRQLREAVERNKAGRASQVGSELDFARAREEGCSLLMDLLQAGKLPLRVTHNDTKMSNVLIDDATGKALCVIDLDTVMPGLAAFDLWGFHRGGGHHSRRGRGGSFQGPL